MDPTEEEPDGGDSPDNPGGRDNPASVDNPVGVDSPAGVDVAVTRERHVWTFEEWPITNLMFETGGMRLMVSKLAGSAEIRVAGRFTLEGPAGSQALDAADTASLAPVLSLVGLPLGRIDITAEGGLTLAIGDRLIVVRADPRFPAWAAQGSGVLDGFGYVCSPAGGPPW